MVPVKLFPHMQPEPIGKNAFIKWSLFFLLIWGRVAQRNIFLNPAALKELMLFGSWLAQAPVG